MNAIGLLPLLLLAACVGDDFRRPGTWQPTGVNNANLRAMLADPKHAEQGVGIAASRGVAAATPVARLLAGKRARLPPADGGFGGSRGGGGGVGGGGGGAGNAE